MTDAMKSFSPIRMTAATEEAAVSQALQIVGAMRENATVEVLSQDAKGVTVRVSPRKIGETAPSASVQVENTPSSALPTPDEKLSTRFAANGEKSVSSDAVSDDEDGMPSGVYMSSGNGALVTDAMEASVPIQLAPQLEAQIKQEAEAATLEEVQAVAHAHDVLPTLSEDAPGIENSEIAMPESIAEEIEVAEVDDASKERARALGQEMLDRMGMEAQVNLSSAPAGSRPDSPRIYLQIDGEDVGILIGKHGQTLQSFQYLLNVSLNNRGEESEKSNLRVSVDAGGYRARRGDALQQMALEAASRATRDKRSVRLEPMSAHERRLVHMALQNDGTVSTSSEGREPLRHVVVIPAGARTSAPENRREGGSYSERSGGGFGAHNNRGNSGGRGSFSGSSGGFGSRGGRDKGGRSDFRSSR